MTPYMDLMLPDVSSTSGPDWADDLNVCIETIDAHDHTTGKGTQVPTAGININADLTLNTHNLTGAKSVRMSTQGSPLATAADIGCLYVSGADLWFNDTGGNQIQLTASGALNAASVGGIGGDYSTSTASVAYSSTTKFFTFLQASLTPAKIDVGPIVLRKASASSNGITLAPAAGIASDYNLTLPAALPGSTSFVGIDSSGNLSFTNSLASLALSAGLTVGTTLGVTGAVTLADALSIGTTLGVTGAVTLSNTLGVTGATTLSSTLAVTGVATFAVPPSLPTIGTGTPTANGAYADLLPKAWARVATNGTVSKSVNLTCTRASLGVYNFTFKRNMADANYAIIANTYNFNDGVASPESATTSGFTIATYQSGTLGDLGVSVVIMGTE